MSSFTEKMHFFMSKFQISGLIFRRFEVFVLLIIVGTVHVLVIVLLIGMLVKPNGYCVRFRFCNVD